MSPVLTSDGKALLYIGLVDFVDSTSGTYLDLVLVAFVVMGKEPLVLKCHSEQTFCF